MTYVMKNGDVVPKRMVKIKQTPKGKVAIYSKYNKTGRMMVITMVEEEFGR